MISAALIALALDSFDAAEHARHLSLDPTIVVVAETSPSDDDRPAPRTPSAGPATPPPAAPTAAVPEEVTPWSDPTETSEATGLDPAEDRGPDASSAAVSGADGRPTYETDPGWSCRFHGNQRCGIGVPGEWIDFSDPTPVVSWGASPDAPVDLSDDTDPVTEPAPTEIVETVETDTGHQDLDADGNVRNESEADRDRAIKAITERATVTLENGFCVWRTPEGKATSVSSDPADCGGTTEPEPLPLLPNDGMPGVVVNGEAVEVGP